MTQSTPILQIKKKLSISNPLTLESNFFHQTTSKSTYKPFKKHHFPERVENKNFGILPLKTSPQTYKSMYSCDFNLKESPKIIPKKKNFLIKPN